MTHFHYYQPTRLSFGPGSVNQAGLRVAQYGRRCLVVSEPVLDVLRPAYTRIFLSLTGQGINVTHFAGVAPNPPTTVVEAGRQAGIAADCDVVLAIGGGSSLDSAKMIAATINVATIDWPHWFARYHSPFDGIKPLPAPVIPLIAIPTTSGTGSHVTHAAVITDVASQLKRTLFHPDLCPREAIIDPELMLTLPPRMTAMTGFDAFCHAFESYTGSRPSPLVDSLGLAAMKRVVENLPDVVSNGSDLQGRCRLASADTLAGIALANGGAGAPHPLAEMLGSRHTSLAHGLTLAVVYPAYLRRQWRKQPQRYATVAELFGARGSTEEKARSLATHLITFLQRIGLEHNLSQAGVTAEDVAALEPALCFDLPLTSGEEMKTILRASLA